MFSFFARRFNPLTDIPHLVGRVALVTGTNSGMGYQTALQLASHGAKVWLTTRSEGKALDTVRRMEEADQSLKGSGRLNWFVLELNSVAGTKAAAERFLKKEERLDILVNNAAQLPSDYKLTSEGLSEVFAADYVSPFVLTTTLLPLLEKTARLPGSDVRVVTVASSQHSTAPATTKFETSADFRDFAGPESTMNSNVQRRDRYAQAKLADILFARELQKRWDVAGVPAVSVSLHPGDVATEGLERMIRTFGAGLLWPLVAPFFRSALQGATTALFAATSPEMLKDKEKFKGQYLVPWGQVAEPSELARREELGEALWTLSERVVKEILEKGKVE
ncbi:NADP-binding protein [Dacryopinax primogenitus]|uniref:NADP-binding protein n=1 Tax=Dacryopinax primogenitus (strain DJM 731) TaxID=1858805 RepID=M5G2P3_DACPD|nr:NADP-binding protein [Dacryopinax primogenitus]EJT98032.1 NADP-binding protein [Dacryopinax primogenitus]